MGKKYPAYVHRIQELHETFENPITLFVKRDPRTIIASYLRYQDYRHRSSDDYWITDNLDQALTILEKAAAPWLSRPELFTTISYEELVANSPKIITRICDRIGVPFEVSMLNYDNPPLPASHISARFERRGEELPWKKMNLAPINRQLAFRWRTEIREAEFAAVKRRLTPLMKGFGYEF